MRPRWTFRSKSKVIDGQCVDNGRETNRALAPVNAGLERVNVVSLTSNKMF